MTRIQHNDFRDFRVLPRGATLIAPLHWGHNGKKHATTALPVITAHSDEAPNHRLPTHYLVVLGLLPGSDDYDGLIVCGIKPDGSFTEDQFALAMGEERVTVNTRLLDGAVLNTRILPAPACE